MDLDPPPTLPGSATSPPTGLEELAARTFDAVLFDMDGTLIDSTASVRRSWLRWAQEEGVDQALLVGNYGVPAAAIIARVLADRDADEQAASLARVTDLEMRDVDGIVELPGAREALAALAAGHADPTDRPPRRAARSAIATSCTGPLAAARIAAAGLVAPDVLVTADDVERGKPDPEPYLLAARRVGADPRRCLVVEDAPAGLVAGRAAGCATLAVVTTSPVEALREVADAVVADLSEVRFAVTDEGVVVRPAGRSAGSAAAVDGAA